MIFKNLTVFRVNCIPNHFSPNKLFNRDFSVIKLKKMPQTSSGLNKDVKAGHLDLLTPENLSPVVFNFLREYTLKLLPSQRYVAVSFHDFQSYKFVKFDSPAEGHQCPRHFIIVSVRFLRLRKFHILGTIFLDDCHDYEKMSRNVSDVMKLYIQAVFLCKLTVVATVAPPSRFFRGALGHLTGMPKVMEHQGCHIYSVGPVRNIVHLHDPSCCLEIWCKWFLSYNFCYNLNGCGKVATSEHIKEVIKRKPGIMGNMSTKNSNYTNTTYNDLAELYFSDIISSSIADLIKQGVLGNEAFGTSIFVKLFGRILDDFIRTKEDSKEPLTKSFQTWTFFVNLLKSIEITEIIYQSGDTYRVEKLARQSARTVNNYSTMNRYAEPYIKIVDDPMGDIPLTGEASLPKIDKVKTFESSGKKPSLDSASKLCDDYFEEISFSNIRNSDEGKKKMKVEEKCNKNDDRNKFLDKAAAVLLQDFSSDEDMFSWNANMDLKFQLVDGNYCSASTSDDASSGTDEELLHIVKCIEKKMNILTEMNMTNLKKLASNNLKTEVVFDKRVDKKLEADKVTMPAPSDSGASTITKMKAKAETKLTVEGVGEKAKRNSREFEVKKSNPLAETEDEAAAKKMKLEAGIKSKTGAVYKKTKANTGALERNKLNVEKIGPNVESLPEDPSEKTKIESEIKLNTKVVDKKAKTNTGLLERNKLPTETKVGDKEKKITLEVELKSKIEDPTEGIDKTKVNSIELDKLRLMMPIETGAKDAEKKREANSTDVTANTMEVQLARTSTFTEKMTQEEIKSKTIKNVVKKTKVNTIELEASKPPETGQYVDEMKADAKGNIIESVDKNLKANSAAAATDQLKSIPLTAATKDVAKQIKIEDFENKVSRPVAHNKSDFISWYDLLFKSNDDLSDDSSSPQDSSDGNKGCVEAEATGEKLRIMLDITQHLSCGKFLSLMYLLECKLNFGFHFARFSLLQRYIYLKGKRKLVSRPLPAYKWRSRTSKFSLDLWTRMKPFGKFKRKKAKPTVKFLKKKPPSERTYNEYSESSYWAESCSLMTGALNIWISNIEGSKLVLQRMLEEKGVVDVKPSDFVFEYVNKFMSHLKSDGQCKSYEDDCCKPINLKKSYEALKPFVGSTMLLND